MITTEEFNAILQELVNKAESRVKEHAECLLDAAACSVTRVRYMVDVQAASGRWDNVEVRYTETEARDKEREWRAWLDENRKAWKDIRIVKELTIEQVLQNVKAQTPLPAGADAVTKRNIEP